MSWIKLLGLPGYFYKRKFLIEIGGLIGKVAKLDINTDNIARGRFFRMAMYVNLDEHLALKSIHTSSGLGVRPVLPKNRPLNVSHPIAGTVKGPEKANLGKDSATFIGLGLSIGLGLNVTRPSSGWKSLPPELVDVTISNSTVGLDLSSIRRSCLRRAKSHRMLLSHRGHRSYFNERENQDGNKSFRG
ncbi:hypothetical protein Gorai_024560 [Gossypium raimondii]|uniref:DUF4283 domain-containing protein n=1 Tax=Gossypium raimondii TaxID=29730 RepID=A0A7J8P099_GOSRA|nr:hypothetical protein [Gossypium raimondii]